MELGRFYASKMALEMPFEYVLLDRRSASDYETTLREVKSLVEAAVISGFDIAVST